MCFICIIICFIKCSYKKQTFFVTNKNDCHFQTLFWCIEVINLKLFFPSIYLFIIIFGKEKYIKIRSFITHNALLEWCLTLILLEPKVISICHQYRARLACTSVQSDQALYCWLTNYQLQIIILISLKMIMGSFKRWIIPF